MGNVKHICGENEDSDEVSDPQYELFLENLKKYKKSCVLKGMTNDVSVCTKFEGREHTHKCGAADQSHRLPNEQAPVNLHASDNVSAGRNEISKEKPDLKNKGILKESEVGFSKDNLGSCKVLKNMIAVPEDNIVTDNQIEPHVQAQLTKADNGIIKRSKVGFSEALSGRMEKLGSCKVSKSTIAVRKDNIVTNKQSETVSQAQPIKRRKGLKGKNVVLSEHNLDTEKHLFLKPDPKHNSGMKYQADLSDHVVTSEENKGVQMKTNFPKVMTKKNLVTVDCVANRKAVNYKDKEPLYPKPSSEENLEEPQHDDADRAQSGKKHKVQRQRKLRKVVCGSLEIKVDDAASRNDMAQIENEPLFHKACPRKNQVSKNCVDQARLEQCHSLFMNERDITDDRDSDVEIINSASFYRVRDPGLFMTSNKFLQTVVEDDDTELLGRSSMQFDFRRQVVNVLRKPYGKQESKILRKAFVSGSFVKFHPELVRKITVHRHEKGICLGLLRGFFFWLENLTRDGSFKPWLDGECLEVDPTLHLYQPVV